MTTCTVCGLPAHPGMRFERVFAAMFNGAFNLVVACTKPLVVFVRKSDR